MKTITKKFSLMATCALLLAAPQSFAGKKFKRALVIAGGSVTPAVGLGIVEGLRLQGKMPDVIITTCGSSLASMLMNSYGTPQNALKNAKSETFYHIMQNLQINTPNALDMMAEFKFMENNQDLIPSVYARPLLRFPENFKGWIPNTSFSAEKSGPRFIIQASKALFSPDQVGQRRTDFLYQQVYFTDSDTAQALEGAKSPVRRLYPNAYVRRDVKVISNIPADQAARAGISDPFLLNPAKINGEYYFTGAIDLIPLELAHNVADEVISTYPQSLFESYEDLVIRTNFGFKQSDRVLSAIQDKKVRWIDMTSLDNVNLEPIRQFLSFENRIPGSLDQFQQSMQTQFDFGYGRGKEAAKAANNTSHLRTPINPKLAYNFVCANANVWMTRFNKWCTSDAQMGCNRQMFSECSPIR